MEKIYTGLYGGKSIFKGVRDTKYTERAVYCDHCDECDFYKQGMCLRVVNGLNHTKCVYGRSETKEGYTPKAKKCYEWNKRVKEDPAYNKLSHPKDCYAARVGEYIYLNMAYVSVEEDENGNKKVSTRPMFQSPTFLKEDEIDLMIELLNYVPRDIFGNRIMDYHENHVPKVLTDLRRNLPDIYKKIIEKDSTFDIAPNYIGRKAYIKTLADGCTITERCGNREYGKYTFDKKSMTLSGVQYSEAHFGESTEQEVRFKVSDKMTYEIDDNSQVCEDTRFI